MRHMLRFGWAAVIGLALGGTAPGQQQGGSTGGGTSGGTGGGGTGGGGTDAGGGFNIAPTPTITGIDSTQTNRNTTGVVNPSNFLSGFYANPYFQGRAGSNESVAPGGFGQALYGTTATGGGGFIGQTTGGGAGGGTRGGQTGLGGTQTGFGGTQTGFGGTQTGFGGGQTGLGGGRGGTTAFGGAGFGGQSAFGGQAGRGLGGQLGGRGLGGQGGFGQMGATSQAVGLPRQISYTAVLRFQAPPVSPVRLQSDLRAILDRSASISNARGVDIQTDGEVVVLRGSVRDEEEARLIEGMIRLTPGVRNVQNELKFPRQPEPRP